MRAVFRILLVGVLGLMVASCARSEFEQAEGGGSGPVGRVAFSAAVNPQYNLSYTSAESSDVDLDQIQWPTASDFTLDILSAGSVVQTYPYASMPAQLELMVGAYSLHAHSGANAEAWNAPYFEGVQDFSLSSSSTSFDAKLACGLQSTLVYLVFDENFSTIFSDYTAYLNTDHTKEAWVWRAGETRVACMRPTEQLLIRVDVTMRSNGRKYDYGINPLVDLKAGELNVVRFSMVGGEVKATISQDNAVAVQEKTVTLMADWLAHRKTSILATFDLATALEHIYGLPYTTPTDVVVRSNVGLKSLTLKPSGDLALLLGAAGVDLHGANNVQAKTGLVLTKAEGAMAYDGRLNFKECLNTLSVLSGGASEYIFAVEAVDLLGETSTFEAKINLSLPELGARSVDGAKVWNRYAKVPGVPVTDARVPAEYRETFAFEYAIREGEGDWQSLGRHTGTADIYRGALKPATTYTTAVVLSGNYVAEASFTTDPEPQIPNGDFAQSALPPAANDNIIDAYYEPTGWATLNALTTQNYSTSAYASQAYPCVKVENGAAVLTSRGWGPGNRIQHSWTKYWPLNENQWGRFIIENATEGRISLDIPFTAKPKSLQFNHKYQPKADGVWEVKLHVLSNETVIGTGYYKASSSEFVGEFTPIEVQVAYVAAHTALVSTSIELYFSGEASAPQPNTTSLSSIGVDAPGGWNIGWPGSPNWVDTKKSYFEGSKLTIDDVELVYLQDITERYTIQ